jgi:predicted CXXCH cytochrome family protein
MKIAWKDAGHLVRLVSLLAVGVGIFLAVRAAVVPKGFGQYGHFRPGALEDNRNRPLRHAGHAACELCHPDIAETKGKGKHVTVNCEACHGPQQTHVDDPAKDPGKPDVRALCVRCHEKNAGRPVKFPQVVSKQHYDGGLCKDCHQPHSPGM